MQVPKLATDEPFIPDLQAPNGTDQEDKLSADMIEHGYRDTPMVCHFSLPKNLCISNFDLYILETPV